MTLPIAWTSHLLNNPKEKESLENTIKSSTTIINRLLDIYKDKERALYKASISPSSYENKEWSIERARYDGRLQEIEELKQLLTIN